MGASYTATTRLNEKQQNLVNIFLCRLPTVYKDSNKNNKVCECNLFI